MKFFSSQFTYFASTGVLRRNLKLLFRFLGILVLLVTIYSIAFHYIMEFENRQFSWVTGFYWTLTVMSTLGFGDITFLSDLGKIFSMIVLVSGVTFLLVLLPFTFIEFFYAPWLEAQRTARAPRKLNKDTKGHVIIVNYDSVTKAFINKLKQYQYPYVLLVPDVEEALRLNDMGISVVVGELDDPETYKKIQVQSAILVATTASDYVNTNVAFTVREISTNVPTAVTASLLASVDILKLAGATKVIQLAEMMGNSFARRTIWSDAITHVIGQFNELLFAEATAAGTPLVGKKINEINLRQLLGITIVGVWNRGQFEIARSDTVISHNTVLLLAGSQEQIKKYDELFCIYHIVDFPVIIIGGGKVGRSTGRALAERQIDYRIVEKLPERVRDPKKYVVGDAANLEILEKAGIMNAPTVIITTHDDDINIYLTIYCRRLRPDIQIISRATLDRNVATMHRAGADFVMSYSSMGANAFFNCLRGGDLLLVTEGLNIFRVPVPGALEGKTIAESSIRESSGCTIIAVENNKSIQINPESSTIMNAGDELILIGDVDAEDLFLRTFVR